MRFSPTRRHLILGAAAAVSLPKTGFAQEAMIEYSPGLVRERLAAGETVLADFSAVWCSTCRAQGRAIDILRRDNPAFDQAITFIRVDWDNYGRSQLAFDLSIPRRSTLVLLRGDQELGRLIANTRVDDIEALLNRALA